MPLMKRDPRCVTCGLLWPYEIRDVGNYQLITVAKAQPNVKL